MQNAVQCFNHLLTVYDQVLGLVIIRLVHEQCRAQSNKMAVICNCDRKLIEAKRLSLWLKLF